MKVVKRIKKAGWPVYTSSGKISQKWKKGHKAANIAARKKFGSKTAKSINKIKVPSNELLGSHTKAGKVKVSSRVTKHLRKAIAYHERIEHKLMTQKKKR